MEVMLRNGTKEGQGVPRRKMEKRCKLSVSKQLNWWVRRAGFWQTDGP